MSASPFETICTTAFKDVTAFVSADGLVWWAAIAGVLYFYEALMGAGELAMGKEDCRLFNPNWWLRQIFVQGLTGLFVATGIKFAGDICGYALGGYGDALVTICQNGFQAMIQESNGASNFSMAALANKTILTLSGFTLVQTMAQTMGIVLSIILGCLCMLFVVFQAYLAIGCSAFTCCLGPICIPFGASSSTQDIALGWLRLFLVYGVLYTPMLAIALQIAGDCMAANLVKQMMESAKGTGMMFDIYEAVLSNLATPFAMLGFVVAVPHVLSKALK